MICRPERLEAIQKHRRPDRDCGGRHEKIKMKLNTIIAAGLIVAAQLGITAARAQTSEVDVNALVQRLQQLEQQVKVLERKGELDKEAAAEKAKATPTLSIGASGLQATSGDTNFSFALRGLVQVDNRTFFGDGGIQGNDSFLLRRARPIFQGTVFRDYDFLFTPDFAGSAAQIVDAYLNYRYAPWLQFRAGKFKVPVGLELLQSDPVTSFNERALPTALVPSRDVGFQIWGEVGGGVLSYAAGIFNGVGDARSTSNADFDDNREFAARLFLQPFKKSDKNALRGLGFGVGGSWGDYSVTNTTGLPNGNGYITDGQQQFFAYNPTGAAVVTDGEHWRLAPQGYYYVGPFSLLGEYTISSQNVSRNIAPFESATLKNTGWQVAAGWVLTGEDATFTGVTPRNAFDPRNGKWGAFQIVGRYAELDVDDDAFPLFSNPLTSASGAQSWSAGLNWYLNKNLLIKASYARTTFDGGGGAGAAAPAAVTRQPEEVFFTRMQLSF